MVLFIQLNKGIKMTTATLKAITLRDTHTRMFLSPDAELHDCTGQGHTRFALDNDADLKNGWIRIVFMSDKYSGQRLVIEAKTVNDNQAIVIAQIVRLSKVQTTSLYDIKGNETRVIGSSIRRQIAEVYN